MAVKYMYGIPNLRGLALPPDDKDLATNLVSLAETAEEAERYEDTCFYLKLIIAKKADNINDIDPLEQNERNLLSAAFKNVVGSLRSSARHLKEKIAAFRSKVNNNDEDREKYLLNIERAKVYSGMVNKEVIAKCKEVVDLLVVVNDKNNMQKAHRKILIPEQSESQDKNEEAVFYLKMKGDYFRYMAEVESNGTMLVDVEVGDKIEKKELKFSDLAIQSYEQASTIAKKLTETSPIRLGLALNHSVCLYEIMEKKKDAIKVAHDAFNEAIQKLDQLNDQTYKDSTLIMQLLRDNLALWQKANEDKAEGGEQQED